MSFKTKQVADKLGVSPNTIRNYSSEFAEFLSDSASPEWGVERSFTEADLEILAAIAAWKKRGHTYKEIKRKLARGDQFMEDSHIAGDEAENYALAVIDQYRRTIEPVIRQLMADREALQERLMEAQREIGRLQALLDSGGTPIQTEVEDLQRRVEELERLIRENR